MPGIRSACLFCFDKKSLNNKGLTLTECILALAMLFILAGTITLLFTVGLRTFWSGYTRKDIRQEMGLGMQRMLREVRQAKSASLSVTSSQIDFSADLNSDLGGDEDYRYRLSDSSLLWSRTNPSPTAEIVLVGNLDLTASSFSEAGNLITVQMQGSRDEQTVLLRSQIRPRNL